MSVPKRLNEHKFKKFRTAMQPTSQQFVGIIIHDKKASFADVTIILIHIYAREPC